jgi:hypothetical protein
LNLVITKLGIITENGLKLNKVKYMSNENLRKDTYAILKVLKNGEKLNGVLLVDSNSEIWEFDDINEAQKIADILTSNSDSGWIYCVRKI